jgi:HD-GYP domain-containing protein (c-di-GMP phosphodiesterase class II)
MPEDEVTDIGSEVPQVPDSTTAPEVSATVAPASEADVDGASAVDVATGAAEALITGATSHANANWRDEHEPGSELITTEVAEVAASVQTFSTKQLKRARDLLARLYGLRRARRLYPYQHPAVAESARDLMAVISAYHSEGVDVPLTFFEDEVLLGEQVLAEDSVLFDQLIRDMISIGAGSIVFGRGLSLEELIRFSTVLGARAEEVASIEGGLGALIERTHVSNITVGTVAVMRENEEESEEGDIVATKMTYTNAIDLMRELERLVRSTQVMNVGHVKGTVRSLVDNILRNRFAMLELSGLKSFDEYTFYHSVNVAILSLALGSTLTRDYRFLSSLGIGALLHDVGKMSVDVDVLNKTGPLTSEEWAEMRHHPVYGAEIVATTSGVDRSSITAVLEHHMRWDLTGYPPREPKRQQHIMGRIVAVADSYDAMTSQRPYSSPRMQDEAMNIVVRSAGNALDPALVRLFVNMLGYFPPRSVVLLSSGETAVVVSPSATDPSAPRVRIITNPNGGFIDPIDIDLSETEESAGRTVERCLDPAGLNVEVADFL